MDPYLTLKIGETEYKKPNLSALQKLEVATKYALVWSKKDPDEINRENRSALMKVTVNGEPLDNELKINNFFSSRSPKEFTEVAKWAWMGGVEDFLDALITSS
jgi:hypothetical protein